jgi:DnaK suppressor protein
LVGAAGARTAARDLRLIKACRVLDPHTGGMNQRLDLEALRRRLEARTTALMRELRDDRDKLDQVRDDAVGEHDRKDEAERVIRAELGDAEYERDLAEARDVEDALRRMDEGRYGSCIECGEAIAPARLNASPWAARCVTCQREHERAASRDAG